MHWFASLVWRTSTKSWAMIFSLSHYNVFCSLLFADLLRSSFRWSTVHVLFSDSLLRDSRKVSSLQFQWTKTIAYRVTCDEMFVCKFSIHARMFRFCQDVLSKSDMFRNLWSCLHVKIWRNVLSARNWRMSRCFSILVYSSSDKMICLLVIDAWLVTWLFVCFNLNEMFWQLICISFLTSQHFKKNMFNFWRNVLTNDLFRSVFILVHMLRFWRDVLTTILYFAVYDRFLHAKIVLDVWWIISLLIRFTIFSYCLQDAFYIKCSIKRFVSHERRFFYKIWRDVQTNRVIVLHHVNASVTYQK